MRRCALCGNAVTLDKYFTRKTVCPYCGADLHSCLNCAFYSPSSHNRCREPKAEYQRVRDKANFCDFFVYRTSQATEHEKTKKETLKALEDLFKKT